MKKILALGVSSILLGASIATPSVLSQDIEDRIKNVTFATKAAVVLMPCLDKSGNAVMGVPTKNEFCTEVFNQLIRDGGAKTVSWFKVNKELEKVVNGSWWNPFSGSKNKEKKDLTGDLYLNELIIASKRLKAKYIVRAVVLNKDSTSSTTNKGPGAAAYVPYVGIFANKSGRSETKKSSNVTIKFDVISIPEEDIVATRTFTGDVNTTKKQQGYGGFEMSNASFNMGGMDAGTRAAMTDALYKGVEYLADRIN